MLDITNLKELEKLLQLCRKRGVKAIKLGDIEFELNDYEPSKARKSRKYKDSSNEDTGLIPPDTEDKIQSDSLTTEQLIGWSVVDIPGETKSS